MRFIVMFVTAVCVLFLIKLRWPKKKNFYETQANIFICLLDYLYEAPFANMKVERQR